MSINSNKNKDIDEIFLHIKKLKGKFCSYEDKTDNISPDDIFEIVDQDEQISNISFKNSGICDICGQDINFDENLSGLVLLNRFFACEDCCNDASNDVLNSWIQTRNARTEDVNPIALWLMIEKHKTRLI
jgi:hypothetical protein